MEACESDVCGMSSKGVAQRDAGGIQLLQLGVQQGID